MAFRRQMEDSESWRASEHIEAREFIIEGTLFFRVHHSFISYLWKLFQTNQTVVRRLVVSRPRITTSANDRYIATVAKRNRRSISTSLISMAVATIGKTISATTVRWRLHINGPYAQVQRVCVPLFIQFRSARLKWCRQHVNWTVSGATLFS